ncbi:MAG: hypothetical protein ACUVX9_10555 [Anaerolineae bacterium]
MVTLTPRQQQFYDALRALCSASGRSTHYSSVAQLLAVSPSSAYDMLKTLERKGAVRSEYVLDGATPGPGRSAIRFYPHEPGRDIAFPNPQDDTDWQQTRQGLLQRLVGAGEGDVGEVLSDMLNRLSDAATPLAYCIGVVAALLMNLRACSPEFPQRQLRLLGQLLVNSEVSLGTLAGLSIGASLSRLRGSPLLDALIQSARRLETHVSALGADSRRRLAELAGEALLTIGTSHA